MDIYLGQNPINPPITQPYPYGDSYEHIKVYLYMIWIKDIK
jgi:hypothetical protein